MQVQGCYSKSRYGKCGRPLKHRGNHAVPIGNGITFEYTRHRAKPIGYVKNGEVL